MSNVWKDAVIDALTINWALKAEHKKDPRKAVQDLVTTEVAYALDPRISQAAAALINERDSQWRDCVMLNASSREEADRILEAMGMTTGGPMPEVEP